MTRRTRVAAVSAAAALLLVAGCKGTVDQPPPVSLACPIAGGAAVTVSVGLRSTSAMPDLPTAVSAPLTDSARAGAQITIIRADGAPEVVFAQSFKSTAANGPARRQDQNRFLDTIRAQFGGPVKAMRPEADPLRALTLAADATPAGGTIVMADSGLQTVAPLRFQDGHGQLLDSEPKEIVSYLRTEGRQSLVPNLAGRSVIFLGLGRTAGSQPTPDQDVRRRLADIWTAIAKAGDASCIDVRTDPPTGTPTPGGLPAVAPVPMPQPPPPPVPCGRIVLGDREVSFVADEAVFKDEAAARGTIGRVAKAMGRRSTALLTGTTANVNGLDGQLVLSKQRAGAVGRVLESMGIDPSRITTRGLGSRFSGYVRDHDAAGHLLPGPAAANRKVIVQLRCPDQGAP
jgi:OmpA-OmpF porin, OOP family